jgi:hypothetical protein
LTWADRIWDVVRTHDGEIPYLVNPRYLAASERFEPEAVVRKWSGVAKTDQRSTDESTWSGSGQTSIVD